MPFYTWILKSLKDDGHYYGHTKDLFKKLSKNVIPKLLCSLFCHEPCLPAGRLHEFSLMGLLFVLI